MPGLIELLAIFVIGTTVTYAMASKLAGSRFGEVYAFMIQLAGAYAASFVIDMLRMAICGEIAFNRIAIPQANWTIIAVIAYFVARRAGASGMVVAAPYIAIAFLAAVTGVVDIRNIVVAAVMLRKRCFFTLTGVVRLRLFSPTPMG